VITPANRMERRDVMDTPGPDGARLIHLDAVGGIAGDMFAAAMLDAFPALTDRVMADVRAVLPPNCGEPRLEPGFSSGIHCLRFGLATSPNAGASSNFAGLHPSGDHDHAGHHHHHDQAPPEATPSRHHDHTPCHHHSARFADLKALIAAAPLAPGTAREAIAILSILARAEARIHGVEPDHVQFHEVGDWDSLMDVVAAGSIAAALAAVSWTVSDLPRGGGLVRTQHGLLPVPAPATAEILSGFRWHDDGIGGERVTPTGAAILRHLCPASSDTTGALGALMATGTGAGMREIAGMPNILRATVFAAESGSGREAVELMSFDIDDMTGEEIAVAADRLRACPGVIDLTLHTLSGKKGRPVCRFEMIAESGRRDAIAALAFAETSTLGLRWRGEQRMVLRRRLATRHGIRVKTAIRPDGDTTKVESDELATIAGLARRRAAARAAEARELGDD
jgi:uncharacterized protein (TIGR00299 family) protein